MKAKRLMINDYHNITWTMHGTYIIQVYTALYMHVITLDDIKYIMCANIDMDVGLLTQWEDAYYIEKNMIITQLTNDVIWFDIR